ncbi:MAG: hypothetical protein CR971_00500 [candidate division SR1 bacterium]|nr:MAG: hypothetical protein CR971_00500 [candidate division SR1 bacterium]
MKKIYTKYVKIISVGMFCFLLTTFSFALDLYYPGDGGQSDLNVKNTHIKASGTANENYIIRIIDSINEYLWFFVGLTGLILLAYGGFKIMTAQGDKKIRSDSYNLIIAAIIMIFIAILSYAIVKLIVNLF